MTEPKVTICPPGKAYGYDRETLTKEDKWRHDLRRDTQHGRDQRDKNRATVFPEQDGSVFPRNYDDDPT